MVGTLLQETFSDFLVQDHVESGNILVAIPHKTGNIKFKNLLQLTLFNLEKLAIKTKTTKLMHFF